MNRFKKQLAMLFGGIALITYLSIQLFPTAEKADTPVLSLQDEAEHMQVYLPDEDGLLVPLSIEVSAELGVEDRIRLLIGYMSGKQKIAHFSALFTKEAALKSVSIKDSCAVLNFDEGFKNYRKEQELRLLEALAWGVCQFEGIGQVSLQINGAKLDHMPLGKTPIPKTLDPSIGINHFETAAAALHSSRSITVFCTKKIAGNTYMIPQSRRVEAEDTSMEGQVKAVLKDVRASTSLTQPLYDDQIMLRSFSYKNNELTIDVSGNLLGSNRQVKEDAYNCLLLSLSAMEGVERIRVKVDGVSVSPFEEKESVSVGELRYNEVRF